MELKQEQKEKLKHIVKELENSGFLQRQWNSFDQTFENYYQKYKELESKNDEEIKKVLLDDEGIASTRQAISGILIDGKHVSKDDFWKKLQEKGKENIKETIQKFKEFDPQDSNEKYKEYENLCENYSPTGKPNMFINRLLVGLHPDKLLAFLRKNDTDDICKYIGKEASNWLEDNNALYNAIFQTIKELDYIKEYYKNKENKENEDQMFSCFVSSLGWSIVEYVRDVKTLNLLKTNKNLILTGAPGTGKTYRAIQIAKRLICENNADQDKRIGIVQFHPSYDYTDFVEGLRAEELNNNVFFKRKDGVFKEFCKKALESLKQNYTNYDEVSVEICNGNNAELKKEFSNKIEDVPKYVFIIDEINRGEISKIFGELFFSIDPGYRGKSGQVKTQYQNLVDKENNDPFRGNGFFVPENVYIIGTMNDIDRSVESLDFAFRRRFAWQEVKVDDTKDAICSTIENKNINLTELKDRLKKLNDLIEKDEELGSAFCIGASYLTKIDNYQEDKETKAIENLWNYHIKGIVYEYVRALDKSSRDDKMKKFETAFLGPLKTNKNNSKQSIYSIANDTNTDGEN